MTQNTITLIVLAVLVVFSLPALYRKKKSGDLTLWGKGRNILGQLPSEEAACAAVSSSSRNGSQKDILQFVSSLMKLVRKNHWYIVMPGQLSDGKTKTNLSLVLITQHRVIGLKCYGYGGALTNNGKAAKLFRGLRRPSSAEGAGHCTGSHEAGPARQKQTITTSHMCGCRTSKNTLTAFPFQL